MPPPPGDGDVLLGNDGRTAVDRYKQDACREPIAQGSRDLLLQSTDIGSRRTRPSG